MLVINVHRLPAPSTVQTCANTLRTSKCQRDGTPLYGPLTLLESSAVPRGSREGRCSAVLGGQRYIATHDWKEPVVLLFAERYTQSVIVQYDRQTEDGGGGRVASTAPTKSNQHHHKQQSSPYSSRVIERTMSRHRYNGNTQNATWSPNLAYYCGSCCVLAAHRYDGWKRRSYPFSKASV